MKTKPFISKFNPKIFKQLKDKYPDIPDYVLTDSQMYKLYSRGEVDFVEDMGEYFDAFTWKKEPIFIKYNLLDEDTKREIKLRMKKENPNQVSRDEERFETQEKILETGPSKEPIIVVMRGDKIELIEGWHRTSLSLNKWPNGYEQIAWVGYPKKGLGPKTNWDLTLS